MAELVLFDPEIHNEDYFQLVLEHRLNTAERLKKSHQIEWSEYLGQPITEYVKNEFKTLVTLMPPDEAVYLSYFEGHAAGMGRISRLRKEAGEIKQMYVRPQYRGRGFAKQMLMKLLLMGRELGYTTFLLDVWMLEFAARHIYQSAGFVEVERYTENSLPLFMVPYYVFMEKKEK